MSFDRPSNELKNHLPPVDHEHLLAELPKPTAKPPVNAIAEVSAASAHNINMPTPQRPAEHQVHTAPVFHTPVGGNDHAQRQFQPVPQPGLSPRLGNHPINNPIASGDQPHTNYRPIAQLPPHQSMPGDQHQGTGNGWKSAGLLGAGAGLGLAAGYGFNQQRGHHGDWQEREEREERQEREQREINNIYNTYNNYDRNNSYGYDPANYRYNYDQNSQYTYPYDAANYGNIYDQNSQYNIGDSLANLSLGLGLNGLNSGLGLPGSSYRDPYESTYNPAGSADDYVAGLPQDRYPQDGSLSGNTYGRDQTLSLEQPRSQERISPGIHSVREGENLWEIAQHSVSTAGDTTSTPGEILHQVKRIVESNKTDYPSLVQDPDHIEVGWRLRIPRPDVSSNF